MSPPLVKASGRACIDSSSSCPSTFKICSSAARACALLGPLIGHFFQLSNLLVWCITMALLPVGHWSL